MKKLILFIFMIAITPYIFVMESNKIDLEKKEAFYHELLHLNSFTSSSKTNHNTNQLTVCHKLQGILFKNENEKSEQWLTEVIPNEVFAVKLESKNLDSVLDCLNNINLKELIRASSNTAKNRLQANSKNRKEFYQLYQNCASDLQSPKDKFKKYLTYFSLPLLGVGLTLLAQYYKSYITSWFSR